MEKRKLLLVAISAGIFLVLTIGAAILFFTPKAAASPYGAVASYANPGSDRNITVEPPATYQAPVVAENPAAQGSSQGVDAVDMVRKDIPGLQPAPAGASSGAGTFISVPKPTTAAVPTTAPAGRAAPAAAAKPAPAPAPATVAAAKPAPAVAAKPAPAAAVPATVTTQAAAPKPAAQSQTRVYDDFWVQTGAFSTVASAEGVKATLASKGITSIIENRDVNGTTLFRVRVGPYTSQNEANYWLSLIKSINGFEDSQVRQTQSIR